MGRRMGPGSRSSRVQFSPYLAPGARPERFTGTTTDLSPAYNGLSPAHSLASFFVATHRADLLSLHFRQYRPGLHWDFAHIYIE